MRGRRDGLLLRGMRWRLGTSLLTVLTAAVAVATATLGPLYLHTAGDSLMRRTVAAAAPEQTGISISQQLDVSRSFTAAQRGVTQIDDAGGRDRFYGRPITEVIAGATTPDPGSPVALGTQLFSRTGVCAQLTFASGHCDLSRGRVVVSVRTATAVHVHTGSRIVADLAGRSVSYVVSGVYEIPDFLRGYWWGEGVSDFPFGAPGAPSRDQPTPQKQIDPLIASASTVLAAPLRSLPTVIEDVPLRAGVADLADEAALRRANATVSGTLLREQLHPGTSLPDVLGHADRARHQLATIVAIAATQLVLLALWVLGSQLVRSGEARRAEARVARLRGFPGAGMLWVTAAEPGMLCLFGAVLGVALAFGATLFARAHLFAAVSSIAFTGLTALALGLTLLVIAAALGLGTVRLLRSADLAAGATRRAEGATTLSVVIDVVLVVLAVVALLALATTGGLAGHGNPLASAAPGLIALGIAVIAVQLVLLGSRLGIRASAGSRRVGPFLALRQTARRPGVLRQARVLIIALGLACFATAAWSVARTNREVVAGFQIGAQRVVGVSGRAPATLVAEVDRADPHGRWAMAVIDEQASNATVLAVDASRLATVASWPHGISNVDRRGLAHALVPATVPPVTLKDATLRLVGTVAATPQAARRLSRLELTAWVFTPSLGTALVDLGRLRPGRASYSASLLGECPGSCRLSGLGLVPAPGARLPVAGAIDVTVSGVRSADRPLSADLEPSGWRADGTGVGVRSSAGAVRFAVPASTLPAYAGTSGAGTPPMAGPADVPRTLPVAATRELLALNDTGLSTIPSTGLDGSALDVHPAVSAGALPRVGADAAMVDLPLLARAQTAPDGPDLTDEVWLGPGAPADALTRLRGVGLRPVSVASAASVFTGLERSGPALADDFLLYATLAALLIAAASTLGALGATTRDRATELASLEVAGVPRPVLAAALGLETAILVLTALCGAGAGVLAAALALPALPELSSGTLAPLSYALPAARLIVVVVVVLGVVVLAAAAVNGALLRRMSPLLLRTAPDDVSG